jgi:hypothetical protein
MEDNIIEFSGSTSLDILPEKVLRSAIEKNLEDVIVLGDGGYLASSTGDKMKLVYMLEDAKHYILSLDR